ncbi:hypothetical protein F5883DRAFT_640129 [Diaporthe sp. PMI_573]|nr:hypothetical protein F5883DRAFT_640129 [Diaporthaceae sp. PMI_573]
MAADIHKLLTEHLGITEPVHVVGHDIGGMGREKHYIKHFYDRLCINPSAIGPADVDYYTSMFEKAGAMRAGFDVHRAFH